MWKCEKSCRKCEKCLELSKNLNKLAMSQIKKKKKKGKICVLIIITVLPPLSPKPSISSVPLIRIKSLDMSLTRLTGLFSLRRPPSWRRWTARSPSSSRISKIVNGNTAPSIQSVRTWTGDWTPRKRGLVWHKKKRRRFTPRSTQQRPKSTDLRTIWRFVFEPFSIELSNIFIFRKTKKLFVA